MISKLDATDRPPLQAPLAELERQLIHAYLAGAGYDTSSLRRLDPDEARKILEAASRHASEALSEIEARSDYLRKLHGER
jgi:hypothetical protein